MTPESLEGDIPPDAGPDAAKETSSDAGALGPGSVAGGAGEGVPGAPLADADAGAVPNDMPIDPDEDEALRPEHTEEQIAEPRPADEA